jgi:hypothetical protein
MPSPNFLVRVYKDGKFVRIFDDLAHKEACWVGRYDPPEGRGDAPAELYEIGPDRYVVVAGEPSHEHRYGELIDAAGVVEWFLKNHGRLPPFPWYKDTIKSLVLNPEAEPTLDCLPEPGKIRWGDEVRKVRPVLWRLLHRFLSGGCQPLEVSEHELEPTVRNNVSVLNKHFKAVGWPWLLSYCKGYVQKKPR